MLEPLENQVRAELTLRAQERCLSKEPIQAPEKPQYRNSFKQPNDLVPDWENRMNLPPEDQVSTPGKSAKLRFSSKHLTQKYDVHAPACIIRRAEQEKEPRAVELDPTASLSLGRVHPKARDKRPSAQDVWAKHRHIVDYTRPHTPVRLHKCVAFRMRVNLVSSEIGEAALPPSYASPGDTSNMEAVAIGCSLY
ncbi:hypothetical protein KCU98_g22413, partial [Aureobasidium melanogenum]